MENVSSRLRDLRALATPRLSVRAMAAALDMPFGTYSNYESSRYKKPTLPLDFTRKVAAVLAAHGVDPAEVMKLAGLSDDEAVPEGRVVEASRPTEQRITLEVVLPSEAALREMFRSLLVLVPEGASKDEYAEILARRLPTGLASIGPLVPEPNSVALPEDNTKPQVPAKD